MSRRQRTEEPEAELRFEDALEQLEGLVGKLEGGDLGLEDALASFEEGVKLVRHCTERLRTAELRIRQLEESAEGPRERPLSLEGDE